MSTTSAWAFETPAAIVPTPTSDTSLTLIRASRFAFFKSWINSARSSIEEMSWCGGGGVRARPGGGDPRLTVRVLQVVDQLGEVFDRVDVVVRWRRDQSNTWSRVTHLRDPGIHLFAGKLSAFPRFCALRHLDLEFLRLGQIQGRNAKPTRGNLFDCAVLRVALVVRPGAAIGA